MASYTYLDTPNPNLVRSHSFVKYCSVLTTSYSPGLLHMQVKEPLIRAYIINLISFERSPFVNPCTTRTCCHTFCYECIARAITISSQCPIDRCPLSIRDIGPADPVIRNVGSSRLVSDIRLRTSVP